jgi:hypothetical protein
VCFGVSHHDSTPTHTALSVREIPASKQLTVLENPPYSTALTSNYFFLCPKTKKILKEMHFDNIRDIKSNTTAALKDIRQNRFQNCFQMWIGAGIGA